MSIQYRKEFFDLLSQLTSISPAISIKKKDGNVFVSKIDGSRTLAYILKAPAEYFDIDKSVSFFNYASFYSFLDKIKGAELDISGNTMSIRDKTTKLTYVLSDEEGIANGPSYVEFDDVAVTFTLTKERLSKIVDINRLVKGDYARIVCSGNTVKITFFTDGDENNLFEEEFECDRVGDNEDDIVITINANRFDYLPQKKDYIFNINNIPYVQIVLVDDEVDFTLYTGDIE